jgi:hypothetical protein
MGDNIFGILPISGNASRMKSIPKFLLPSKINSTLLDETIDIFHKNNINKIIAGVSDTNNLLLSNNDFLEKVIINTKTMSETIFELNKYISTNYGLNYKSILLMPDTNVTITNELKQMIELLNGSYDIVVILWKIRSSQIGKVGQCKIFNNEVVNIIDKDINCTYNLFWGSIGWNSNINEFINPEWQTIGQLLNKSLELNIKIGSIICEGDYYDCGTFEEYFEMIRNKK